MRGKCLGKISIILVVASVLVGYSTCSRDENPCKGSPFIEPLKRNDSDQVKRLIQDGADINKPYKRGGTLLYWLSTAGYADAARILLENGADPNKPDEKRRTPLHVASLNGKNAVVKLLIEHGATVDAVDSGGMTPLMKAAMGNSYEVVKTLLEHGADASRRDRNGDDALAFAVRESASPALMELLTNWKAGPAEPGRPGK